MKSSEVVIPREALAEWKSPRTSITYYEYAVAAGGSVLNHTRYNTPEDAYFYGCALGNARDRERCNRILVKRQVVRRKVVIGDWEPVVLQRQEVHHA